MSSLKERLKAAPGSEGEVPIMSTLGMHLVHHGEGQATLTLEVGKKFHNPMGTLHGGIMTDLADAAMGIATITTLADDESFSTLELKMNFLRPVFEGKITAEGKILHRGSTIAMAECVVKNEAGKDVARGTATQIILRQKE